MLFFALYAEISNFVKTSNGVNMRHFFTRFDSFCVLCVNPTQQLGQYDNQTLSNLIERLSSTKFGNRTQSNLVAGGHVAPKIWEPKISEEKKSK